GGWVGGKVDRFGTQPNSFMALGAVPRFVLLIFLLFIFLLVTLLLRCSLMYVRMLVFGQQPTSLSLLTTLRFCVW
ncbi:hypothetical protein NPN23_25000, partial [Vibrio parahaemolyticus]|nr:hypothetical protein [Vibrio parahaemolyticus]